MVLGVRGDRVGQQHAPLSAAGSPGERFPGGRHGALPAPLLVRLPTLARVTLRRGQGGDQEKSRAEGSVGCLPRTQRGGAPGGARRGAGVEPIPAALTAASLRREGAAGAAAGPRWAIRGVRESSG